MQRRAQSMVRSIAGATASLSSSIKVCLVITSMVSATVLAGWIVPDFGARLPAGWPLMKANTALAMLLSVAAMVLTQLPGTASATGRIGLPVAGKVCAGIVMLLAGSVLLEHVTGVNTGLDILLAADSASMMPGRMSIQTAMFFVLLGLSLSISYTAGGVAGYLQDGLGMALVVLSMMLFGGYAFGAPELYKQNVHTFTSPQTLVCIALLTFVQFSRRAPHGIFAEVVGGSLGSRFMRMLLPFAVALPFLAVGLTALLFRAGWLELPYAEALTAAGMSALIVPAIVLLARTLDTLEKKLKDMSLFDALTSLHNYKGLYLLGEQAMADAQRDDRPVTVIFVDVDGLKKVNDTCGHETGSQLLVEVAHLLLDNFRASDIVGRIGGDEFAVVIHARQDDLEHTLQRLFAATAAANRVCGKPYRISFSLGIATTDARASESFADLLNRADAAMYQSKRQRSSAGQAESLIH